MKTVLTDPNNRLNQEELAQFNFMESRRKREMRISIAAHLSEDEWKEAKAVRRNLPKGKRGRPRELPLEVIISLRESKWTYKAIAELFHVKEQKIKDALRNGVE